MFEKLKQKPVLGGLLLALIIFALDQITKLYMVYVVMHPPVRIEVTSFFNLVMAWNKGVSFGLLASDSPYKPYLLATMAFVAAVGLFIWMRSENRLNFAIPCGAIIGGAIGNGLDRLHWGQVADFLDFHVAGYHWPAFNVADMGITIGATFLIIDSLFAKTDSTKTEDLKS